MQIYSVSMSYRTQIVDVELNLKHRAQFETVEHYLLECRLYYVQRQRLETNLNPDFELNFDLLTSGTEKCNTEQNKDIILAVLRYIKDTQRF